MPPDVEPGAADALAPLLGHLVEVQGSDLFVKAGSVPRVRIDGRLEPTPFAAPDPASIDRLVQPLLPPNPGDELAPGGAADLAAGRSRVRPVPGALGRP